MAALLSLAPLSAHAAPPLGSFSWVRGDGADVCPAREALLTQVESALGRPLLPALEGRAVEAVVTRRPPEPPNEQGGWDVTIFWRASDGTIAGTREIHDDGADCEGVVRNVVTSIIVAVTAGAVDAKEGPPKAVSTQKSVKKEPPKDASSPAKPTLETADKKQPPEEKTETPRPTLGDPRSGGVMIGGVVALGWLPGISYGMQLVAEPVVSGRFRLVLSATAIAEQSHKLPGVTAGFAATEIGGDLCAVLMGHSRRLIEASVCGGAHAGVVQAFVYSGPQNQGGGAGSFAIQGGAELRSYPLGYFFVSLAVLGRVNVTQYVLSSAIPDQPVYTQEAGGIVGSLRVGAEFP